MGERFVWHAGQWMPAAQYYALAHRGENRSTAVPTPTVMGDIQPYRSVATGDMVSSRSQHRQILRENGLVEVGNEKFPERTPYEPQGVEHDVKQAYDHLTSGGEAPKVESGIIPSE